MQDLSYPNGAQSANGSAAQRARPSGSAAGLGPKPLALESYTIEELSDGRREILAQWRDGGPAGTQGNGTFTVMYDLAGNPTFYPAWDGSQPPAIPAAVLAGIVNEPPTNKYGDRLIKDIPYEGEKIHICDTVKRVDGGLARRARWVRCRKHGRYELVIERVNGERVQLFRCPRHARALRSAFTANSETAESRPCPETAEVQPSPNGRPETAEVPRIDELAEFARRDEAWDRLEEERRRYYRSPEGARRYMQLAYAGGAGSFDLEKWNQAHPEHAAELEAEKRRVLAELGIAYPEGGPNGN